MNYIGTMPNRTRPLSYQPLRAGQYRGYGGCNVFPSKTTIVNNNIYGNYGYDYGCCNNYDDGGMSKGMKWMMGFAIGLPIIGSILSAFGIGQGGGGKVDGQGGEETTDQSDTINDLNNKIKSLEDEINSLKAGPKKTEAPVETAPAEVEKPEEEKPVETPKVDFSKFKDGEIMDCIDQGGPRAINGKLSNVKTNEKGVPMTFTITDTSENKKGNTYEYILDSIAEDGTPSYKCVKKNGQNVIGEHKYAFKDGKLVQENDKFAGYGVGVKTASDTQKPPIVTPKKEKVPEGTMKDEVSSKYSSLTPFFNKKDGKWHSTPDQDHSYRDMSYGTSSQKLSQQVADWNKQNPDKQIKIENNKLTTTVSFTSNTKGKISKKVSANNFAELQKMINATINAENQLPRLGYAALGGAMQHNT